VTAYLLDTNHAGALMKDDPRMISALRAPNDSTFHVAMPSVGELWYMVYNSSRIEGNARKLRNLLRVLVILPFDQAAARHFGRLRAELRRAGRPIPPIDLQIAAVAVDRNLTILTTDAHFGHIPGLTVDSWLKL
jgi:tRNA(fMet)-specific endonuclease VapC